jgi:hypothetical protein
LGKVFKPGGFAILFRGFSYCAFAVSIAPAPTHHSCPNFITFGGCHKKHLCRALGLYPPTIIEIAFDIIKGVIATLGVVCGGQTERVRAVAGTKECGTVGARWFQCRNSLFPARGLKLSVISLGKLITFKNCRNSLFPARGLKLAMRTLAAKISSRTLHPCSLAVVQLQIVTIVQKKLKSIHGSYTTAQTRNHGRLPNP